MSKFEEDIKTVTIRDCDTTVGEEKLLYNTAKGLVVELGTFLGRTAAILSFNANKVITIDGYFNYGSLYTKYPDYRYSQVKKVLDDYKITTVKSDTTSTKLLNMLGKRKIDVLFIDADHEYPGVNKDFNFWVSKVKKGGKIIFHDYCDDYIEVQRLVDAAVATGNYEIVEAVDKVVVLRKLNNSNKKVTVFKDRVDG